MIIDSIGVVLEKDKYGKYAAYLVTISDGVTSKSLITDNRAQAAALREMHTALDGVSLGLGRGKFTWREHA